jgi:hypothetical protein
MIQLFVYYISSVTANLRHVRIQVIITEFKAFSSYVLNLVRHHSLSESDAPIQSESFHIRSN